MLFKKYQFDVAKKIWDICDKNSIHYEIRNIEKCCLEETPEIEIGMSEANWLIVTILLSVSAVD